MVRGGCRLGCDWVKRWLRGATRTICHHHILDWFVAFGVALHRNIFHRSKHGKAILVPATLIPLENRILLSADLGLDDPLSAPVGDPATAIVVDRHVFYNDSGWDGQDPAANVNDDPAIAVDKTALLPGQTARFTNYISYSRGINGVMVDIKDLADPTGLMAEHFQFRYGNHDDPLSWLEVDVSPSVAVRPGEGVNGSDRVTLIWPDHTIENQWLEVKVLADPLVTGLDQDDLFYLGHSAGETGDGVGSDGVTVNAITNVSDIVDLRRHATPIGAVEGIANRFDFNRDRRVDLWDLLIARDHATNTDKALQLIAAPAAQSVLDFQLPGVAEVKVQEIAYFTTPGLDGLVAEATQFEFQLLGVFDGLAPLAGSGSVRLYDEDGVSTTFESFELVDGRFEVPSVDLTVDGVTLLNAQGLTVLVSGFSNRIGVLSGEISVLIDEANFLPDQSGSAFSMSASQVGGTIDLNSGAMTLGALRVEAHLGAAVELAGFGPVITIDPADPSPDAVILSLPVGSLSFPGLDGLPSLDVTGLVVRKNGVSLDSFELGVTDLANSPAVEQILQASPVAVSAAPVSTPQRPLLIVPGIVGTFPKANDIDDQEAYERWLLNRGVHPDTMEGEQLIGVNDDLYQSLLNSGYTDNQDIFVVTYDWRMPPAPDDGVIDGLIDGVTAQDSVDEVFESGIDYMGFFLDRAAQAWQATHGEWPDAVDVIAHSTGGLVTRSYIQSSAYLGLYDQDTKRLPGVNHFVSVGVPHRGASKAWGPINDDFSVDTAFQFVLSQVLNGPYQKLKDVEIAAILGPSGNPTGPDAIRLGDILVDGVPSPKKFIELYLPTATALLATYDFLFDENGAIVDINADPNLRNHVALDLNAGVDLNSDGNPNAFIDRMTGQFTVVAGQSETTPTLAATRVGELLIERTVRSELYGVSQVQTENPNPKTIASMTGPFARRAEPGETYYPITTKDGFNGKKSFNGDGTVPLQSSIEQFIGVDGADIKLFYGFNSVNNQPFVPGSYANVHYQLSFDSPDHLALLYLPETQRAIIESIGIIPGTLSLNLNGTNAINAYDAVTGSLFIDPVGGLIKDGQGQPLVGFDASTGQRVEMPGTKYFGFAEGFGLIFDSAIEPGEQLSLELTGLAGGGPYSVGVQQANGGEGGGFFSGVLNEGQQLVESWNFERIFDDLHDTILGLIEVEGLTLSGTGLGIQFGANGPEITGILAVGGSGAALLPDRGTAELDGVATVQGFTGSIDLATGALTFTSDQASLIIDGVVEATASADATGPGISVTIDPSNTQYDAHLATLRNIDITLPSMPELPTDIILVNELVLRRNGLHLDATVGGGGTGVDVTLDGLIEVNDLQINIDLTVDVGPVPGQQLPSVELSGGVEVTAGAVTLLPGQAISLDVVNPLNDGRPAFRGLVDLDGLGLTIDAMGLRGGLALDGESLFSLHADPSASGDPALTFRLDRGLAPDALMFDIPSLTGVFDALAVEDAQGVVSTPQVTVVGFGVQRDGGVELDNIAIDLPMGYVKQLGLGGVVPFEVLSLATTFGQLSDGSVDFTSFSLAALAQVNTSGIQEQLGDLLGVEPVVTIQEYDAAGNLTELSNGGQLTVGLEISQGQLTLVDVPGLALVLSNFVVDLPGASSMDLAGLLILPAMDATGTWQSIPTALVPSELDGLATPPQAVLDLTAVADVGAGTLGGRVAVAGSVLSQPDGSTHLELFGQGTIEGDLSFIGGDASGSVTGVFSWDLVATPQSNGSMVLSGAPQLTGLSFENIVLEVSGLARLTVANGNIDFTAPPGEAIATANNATLEFLIDGLLGISSTIGTVQLFDDLGADGVIDGFSLSGVSLDALGNLSLGPVIGSTGQSLLELTDASLSIPDLTFRQGTIAAGSPEIMFTAAGIGLNLPGVGVSATGLVASLDPASQSFYARATELALSVGDQFDGSGPLFNVVLNNPELLIDLNASDDSLLLSFPSLAASMPVLAVNGVAPVVTLSGFGLRYNGGVELDSVVIDLPASYVKQLGLGGVVPFEIQSFSMVFGQQTDGTADLASFALEAVVQVDTLGVEQQLGNLLGVTPVVTIQQYDDAGVLTDLSNGGQLTVGLEINQGQLTLRDVPGLALGLSNFVVDLPSASSVNLAGSMILPAIDATGVWQSIPPTLVPPELDGLVTPPQVVLDLETLGDVSAGTLGGHVAVVGSVNSQPNGSTLMSLFGQGTIDGDLSFIGGTTSGLVTGVFSWDLVATPQPNGFMVLSGTPQLTELSFENIVLEVSGLARLTVANGNIDFTAPPGEAVATANDATLEFLIDGLQGIGGTIATVQLFDDLGADGVIDGFSLSGVSLDALGNLGVGPVVGSGGQSLLELTDASLSIPDLTFRQGAIATGSPEIMFTAAGIGLNLPGVGVSATGLVVSLDPASQAFYARATELALSVGDQFDSGGSLFNMVLSNSELLIDDDDATDLLSIGSATLGFGSDASPLDALLFSLNPTAVNQDQALRLNLVSDGQGGMTPRFGLGVLALDTTGQQGVLASLGLSGLLPLDIDGASLAFTQTDGDGYTDLSTFDLSVAGAFDFSVFGSLPFTPIVSIGQTPLAGGGNAGGGATDQGNNRFDVTVAFDFSGGAVFPVVPVFQDVQLGLADLELGGFTFGGSVSFAGYRLGVANTLVPLAYGVNALGNLVLVDGDADADPDTLGTQIGPQVTGRLFAQDNASNDGTSSGVDVDFESLEVLLSGSISPELNQTTVSLTGDLNVNGTVRFGSFLILDSFGISGLLNWTLANDLNSGNLELAVTQARTRGLAIGLGDFFQATAGGTDEGPDGTLGTLDDGFLAINFSSDPTVPLIQGLDLVLGSPAIGIYGGVGGIDILPGALPPFDAIKTVTLGITPGSMLDTLQDWFLPIRTNEITVELTDAFFAHDDSLDPTRVTGIADPTAVNLLIDGAVGIPGFIGDALGTIGLDAEVAFSGLGVNLVQMRSLAQQVLTWADALGSESFDTFINTNDQSVISAAFIAALQKIQDEGAPFTIFELGDTFDISQLNGLGLELGFEFGDGLAITGAISVGRADANGQTNDPIDDVYFLGIAGAVKVSSYGGGGSIVLTTAGPIAATIEFGVPIVLGQTTLTLGGGGAIVFGKDLLEDIDTSQPTVNPADIPTPFDWDLTDLATIEGILSGLWDDQANQLTGVWNLPATLAIKGRLSSLAVAGLVAVEGTIAATLPSLLDAVAGTGLSFLGVGDLVAIGLPFASGGVLVDARDPLNPAFSFGFRAPPKDNPLAFLFPVQADLAGTLRTDGAIEAWLIGIKTLIQGGLDGANGPLNDVLSQVAAEMELDRLANRSNALANLLSLDLTLSIDATTLSSAVVAQLGALSGNGPLGMIDSASGDPWTAASMMAQELWTAIQLAADAVDGFDFQSAIGSVMGSFLVGAASSSDAAIQQAYEAFNPSFVMRGALQPTLFGFPIGDPNTEVDLVINKNLITFDLTASDTLIKISSIFLMLGITDRLEIGFTANMPGTLIDILIDPLATPQQIAEGFGDALNPFTGWEAKFAGTLGVLGFNLGKVSGLMFGPQTTDIDGQAIGGTLFAENVHNFGYTDGFELNGLNTALPVGKENHIPVYYDSQYDNMTAFGGLLLTGELRVPDLIRDPIALFNALVELTNQTGATLSGPWSDLTGDPNFDLSDLSTAGDVGAKLLTYFEQVIVLLTGETPLGTLQIYTPSPATLVQGYLDYVIPSIVGAGDGEGELILAQRFDDGNDEQGNPIFTPAVLDDGADPVPALRFADLNGNAFYDPFIDVLMDATDVAWADHVPDGASIGDLSFNSSEDVLVDLSALSGVTVYVLNDVAADQVNGFLDPASSSDFDPAVSVGFVDVNHNGLLDWSADPETGIVTIHETLVSAADGSELTELTALPSLAVFLDEAANEPGGAPDGYTRGDDPVFGLNEGFSDTNTNGYFDLNLDVLYDLNGNDLPDGDLWLDSDEDGLPDATSSPTFAPAVSVGFIDVNHNGMLDWSADPLTGVVTFHETIVDAADGSELIDLTALPNLTVFLDEQALEPAGLPDGYTAPSETTVGDRIVGLTEGFVDTNVNGRFDLGVDLLYDLNGNGLPDGELFIDVDLTGKYTAPEPLDDINGNGVRDVSSSLTEPFTDINDNEVYDTGDPFLELGNGLYDPPADPVFTFDDATQAAQDLFDTAYIDGFVDLTLLGLHLGDGRVRASGAGMFIDLASGPLGLSRSVAMSYNPVNAGEILAALTDSPLAQNGSGVGLLRALLPVDLQPQVDSFRQSLINLAGNFSFPFPVAMIDSGFDFDDIRNWLVDSFGSSVDSLFEFTGSDGSNDTIGATARVEIFSPLFNDEPPVHPTADPLDPRHVDPSLLALDEIQTYGGGRVSATLNLPGFVEGAVGLFEAQFPNSFDDLLAPDFAFLAHVDKFAIPGLSDDILRAENLRLSIVKNTGPNTTLAQAVVTGSVGVLEGFGGGLTASIDGNLTLDANEGLYGQLEVDLGSGALNLGPNGALQLGANTQARLLVNATAGPRDFVINQGLPDAQTVPLDGHSGTLWISGQFQLGSFTIDGSLQVQIGLNGSGVPEIQVQVNGTTTLFGTTASVFGRLASDLTGQLVIDFGGLSPLGADLGEFQFDGTFSIELFYDSFNVLQTQIGFEGVLVLPDWLAVLSPNQPVDSLGRATAAISGGFSTAGDFDLQVTLQDFLLPGDFKIVGSDYPTGPQNDAFFQLKRSVPLGATDFVTQLDVNGLIEFGRVAKLPKLAISGSFSTAGVGELVMSLGDPNKVSTGLDLGGAQLAGGALLSYDATVNPVAFEIGIVNGALLLFERFLLEGSFVIHVDDTGLLLFTKASSDLGIAPDGKQPLLEFNVTGFLKISTVGVAAVLDIDLLDHFSTSWNVTLPDTFQLVVNTTKKKVVYTLPKGVSLRDGRNVVEVSHRADGNSLLNGEPYALLRGQGVMSIGGFSLDGDFNLTVSGRVFSIAVTFNLLVEIPIKEALTVRLLELSGTGLIHLGSAGLAGSIQLKRQQGPDASLGFDFSNSTSFGLQFNTTLQDQIVDGVTVWAGPDAKAKPQVYSQIHMEGTLVIPGLDVTGLFDLSVSSKGLLLLDASVNVDLTVPGTDSSDWQLLRATGQGAIQISASGLAAAINLGLQAGPNSGLNLSFGGAIFRLDLNTTLSQQTVGTVTLLKGPGDGVVAAAYGRVHISGAVITDGFTLTGSFDLTAAQGFFRLDVSANMSVLGNGLAVGGFLQIKANTAATTDNLVSAANLAVLDNTNSPAVVIEQTGTAAMTVLRRNLGDFELAANGVPLDYRDGVALATVRENGRDHGDGMGVGYATVETAIAPWSSGSGTELSLSTTRGGTSAQAEFNVNTAAAYFPFADGWVGAHVMVDSTGKPTLRAASGVSPNAVVQLEPGQARYTIDLGVNSRTDGLLFVTGANNADHVVAAAPLGDGSGWYVDVRENSQNFGSNNHGSFSFVYVPLDTPGLVGGYYNGASQGFINQAGQSTITRTATGRYQLDIPGQSPETGVLLLTGSRLFTDGPDDNIFSYEDASSSFMIESRDLPSTGLQDSYFTFAFIPFTAPPSGSVGGFSGELSVTASGDVFGAGGFAIASTSMTLSVSSVQTALSVEGSLAVPGLASSLTVFGSLDSAGNGTLSASFTGTEGIGGLSYSGDMALVVSPSLAALDFDGQLTVPVLGSVAASGSFNSNGFGTLHLSASQLNLFGFVINGTFDVQRSAGGLFLGVDGTLSFLGNNLVVIDSFTIPSASALSGGVKVTVSDSGPFDIGFLDFNGELNLQASTSSASMALDGTIDLLGFGLISAVGSLNSNGDGSFNSIVEQLTVAGFAMNGTFALNRSSGIWNLDVDAAMSFLGNTHSVDGDLNLNQLVVGVLYYSGDLEVGLTLGGSGNVGLVPFSGSMTLHFSSFLNYIELNGTVTLPAKGTVSANGAFGGDGNGSLSLTMSNITLAGFTLNGNFDLIRSSTGTFLDIDGNMSFLGKTFALNTNADLQIRSLRFGGYYYSGQLALSVAGNSVNLNGSSVAGTFVLVFGLTGNEFRIENATISLADIGLLSVNGQINSAGIGSLTVSTSQITIHGGLTISGTFSILRNSSALTLSVNGSATYLGNSVSVSGSLTMNAFGPSGTLTLTRSGSFGIGGYTIDSGISLSMAVSTSSFSVAISGQIDIPGLSNATNRTISGELDSAGHGTLSISTPSSGISVAGVSLKGTFELERDSSGTTLSVSSSSVGWLGDSYSGGSFSISTTGTFTANFSVTLDVYLFGGAKVGSGTVSATLTKTSSTGSVSFSATIEANVSIFGVGSFTILDASVSSTGRFSWTFLGIGYDFTIDP